MGKSETFSVFFSVFLTLAFVLFLAWFFLRFIGQHTPMQNNSKHIKILDRVVIDREKYLLLISVGKKTMLIAMSANAIEPICEFDVEQQALFHSSKESDQNFSSVFKQIFPKRIDGSGKGGNHL